MLNCAYVSNFFHRYAHKEGDQKDLSFVLFCFERLMVVENKGMMHTGGLLRINK